MDKHIYHSKTRAPHMCTLEEKTCIHCRRKCCFVCFTVQFTQGRFICHDCVDIVAAKHVLNDIIASNFRTKQQKISKYFTAQAVNASARDREYYSPYYPRGHRLHSWTPECVFCTQVYRYREGLYAFGLCESCQTLTKILMQIRWISEVITPQIVEVLCVYFQGYVVPCTNYTQCENEMYIPDGEPDCDDDCYRYQWELYEYGYHLHGSHTAVDKQYSYRICGLYTRLTCYDCQGSATIDQKCDVQYGDTNRYTANILIINLTHVWIIQCVTYAASDLNIHSPVKCAKNSIVIFVVYERSDIDMDHWCKKNVEMCVWIGARIVLLRLSMTNGTKQFYVAFEAMRSYLIHSTCNYLILLLRIHMVLWLSARHRIVMKKL
eukprot:263148_1